MCEKISGLAAGAQPSHTLIGQQEEDSTSTSEVFAQAGLGELLHDSCSPEQGECPTGKLELVTDAFTLHWKRTIT